MIFSIFLLKNLLIFQSFIYLTFANENQIIHVSINHKKKIMKVMYYLKKHFNADSHGIIDYHERM